MNYSLIATGLLAILAGIGIFVFPQALSYLVATYLVIVGLIGLLYSMRY